MTATRRLASLRTPVAVLVAAAAVAVVCMPARVWRQPETDAIYHGFDPGLIFRKEMGADAQTPGLINVSPDEIRLLAPPDSRPTVHLFTTPLDHVQASMEVLPLLVSPGADPFTLMFWNARTGSGVAVTAGPPPAMRITAQAIIEGATRSSLLGGAVVAEQDMGPYSPGIPLTLAFRYDRDAGTVTIRVQSQESPPSGSRMLRLSGGPGDPNYRDAATAPVPVDPGHRYRLSALVRLVDGNDAYKLTVQWLDGDRRHIGFDGDWRSVRSLAGWTAVDVVAEAPAGARWARIFLGSGRGTHLLFADVTMTDLTSGNAVPINGTFAAGASGWDLPGSGLAAVVDPHAVDSAFVFTRDMVPGIFDGLRNTLTITAAGAGGTSESVVRSYTLVLPHQRYYGVKVDDPRARLATIVIGALAALLVAPSIPGALHALARLLASMAISRQSIAAASVVAVLAALLANLGSHPFDMGAARIWAYVAATRPLYQLYYLPNLAPLAQVWNGGPWHEAPFPYGFSLAYLFAATGYIYRLLLAGPNPLTTDAYQLELLLKVVFVAFAIADGLLLYLLARDIYPEKRRLPVLVAALWLASPAVWVSAAIWGQTHVVSAFFLLAALIATVRNRPVVSWTMLAAAAFSRPQMVPLVIPIAILNWRRHGLAASISGMSWATLLTFLCMMPFFLSVGPSFPVDMSLLQLRTQELGGNEQSLRTISLGAHNLWVLVARLQGIIGYARFTVPVDSGSGLTYGQASWLLTGLAAAAASLCALILGQRPASWASSLALGAAAFFVLKTGLAPTHFLLALPLLALATPLWRPLGLFAIAWGAVCAIAMLSGLAAALRDVPQLAPHLAPGSNPVMAALLDLSQQDGAITLLTIINLSTLAAAGIATFLSSSSRPPGDAQKQATVATLKREGAISTAPTPRRLW